MIIPAPPSDCLFRCMFLGCVCAAEHQSVSAIRDGLRCFHILDIQKPPQRLPFSVSTPRSRPGFLLTCGVLTEQMTETCIPGPPLPNYWALRAPMTQPLQAKLDFIHLMIEQRQQTTCAVACRKNF